MSELFAIDFWAFVGVLTGINVLMALALHVQLGYTGMSNFGLAGYMAVSAYVLAIAVARYDIGFWWAVVMAIGAAMLFGLVLALPAQRLRDVYLAIATLAFAEIVRLLALNLTAVTGGPQGSMSINGPGAAASFNGVWRSLVESVASAIEGLGPAGRPSLAPLYLVWLIALPFVVAAAWIGKSPYGRVLKAIREDVEATESLGWNAATYRIQMFVVGGVAAGLAGVLFALTFGVFGPNDFEPLLTVYAYTVVMMGGLGKTRGVVIGAVIFSAVFAGTRFLDFFPLDRLSSTDRSFVRLIIVGTILIAVVVLRPQGIAGTKAELHLD